MSIACTYIMFPISSMTMGVRMRVFQALYPWSQLLLKFCQSNPQWQFQTILTEQQFFNEVLPSSNPSSSNPIETQFNSITLPNPNHQAQQLTMQPTSPAHWSTTRVDLNQTPERVIRAMIQRGLAINSPNLTARLFASNESLASLPPIDEVRVRQCISL